MVHLDLLHLTDLHFTDGEDHAWNVRVDGLASHDQPTLLDKLLIDLRDLGSQPKLVVVSGDLLDKGSEKGVEPVVKFLKDLMPRLGLEISRLFIVPGNHDVLRGIPNRYKLYDKIYEELFGREPFSIRVESHQRVEARYIEELGVELVGFNSCEQATDSDYAGYVGDAQREYARLSLRTGDHFRIGVMHHHLDQPQGQVQRDLSTMTDGATVRKWLVEHRFQLVLHGHQHVDFRNVYTEDGDWNQSIVGGASAGVGEYGRSQWNLNLGYHVIKIRGHKGERIRRHYFRQNRRWMHGGGGDSSVELRFGHAPRFQLTAWLRHRRRAELAVGAIILVGLVVLALVLIYWPDMSELATNGPNVAHPDASACGMAVCGAECVDPRTDERHCGACSFSCEPGWMCLGGRCEQVTGRCPDDMVEVAAGNFVSGCDPARDKCTRDERGALEVNDAFCIDRLEVTARDFAECVDNARNRPPSERCTSPAPHSLLRPHCSYQDPKSRSDHPINCVTWSQAVAYCAWRGRRLPTEKEWEVAARGRDGRRFPWGDFDPDRFMANLEFSPGTTTASVYEFPKGASPFGALNMAGNVAEWTSDWYKQGDESLGRAFRGGSFSAAIEGVRCANRDHSSKETDRIGFRCAMDVPFSEPSKVQ